VTIGADGLGLISYYDATNGDLKVAHCADIACTSATITALDTAGVVGEGTSVTVGADGLGLISYADWTNSNLKVAHCSDLACTSATITALDTSANVGGQTSVAIVQTGCRSSATLTAGRRSQGGTLQRRRMHFSHNHIPQQCGCSCFLQLGGYHTGRRSRKPENRLL